MNADLPPVEFGFPGPLRDALIAAMRSGAKTTTTSLLREYEIEDESLPMIGQRGVVIDSEGKESFVIETTEIATVRLGDVPLEHAVSEGEGYESVAQWREAHSRFWSSAAMRAELGSDVELTDDTLVVLERFIVIR
ncbi:ASCH domain-containing protein [Arthrobacter agilis]|uniref:ASCH domain-containing protein n=1 Tax=Arthrobacter agilis TaxID=37921 RepID=UPI000B358239|nr:ASCH domain-containing protein [Arthrobacter agilis]OUM45679.1 RNA-binding protein [Arthrobacter agilis]PPB47771.1 ASCH domain-containing protein [Arthrobacter agilis]TPV22454.1 ASCH domain-containing protein [Arthrobacter agilis]